jgi:hypothetical protein
MPCGDEHVEQYVWRFRLNEKAPQRTALDPTRELLRVQWEELLRLCVPMYGDRPVKVDGFALMRDLDKIIPIHADDERWGAT